MPEIAMILEIVDARPVVAYCRELGSNLFNIAQRGYQAATGSYGDMYAPIHHILERSYRTIADSFIRRKQSAIKVDGNRLYIVSVFHSWEYVPEQCFMQAGVDTRICHTERSAIYYRNKDRRSYEKNNRSRND